MEFKQVLFRGSRQFWIMSYENRMISLKTLLFQTSPKFLFFGRNKEREKGLQSHVRIKGGLEIFFEKIVCFVYHCFVLFIYHGCFFLVGLYCDFLVDLYCYFFVNCRSSFSWSASATASSFSLIKLYLLNFCFQTLSWFQHLWMIFLTFFYVTLLLLFACVSQIR